MFFTYFFSFFICFPFFFPIPDYPGIWILESLLLFSVSLNLSFILYPSSLENPLLWASIASLYSLLVTILLFISSIVFNFAFFFLLFPLGLYYNPSLYPLEDISYAH